jgi:hypothetical protein
MSFASAGGNGGQIVMVTPSLKNIAVNKRGRLEIGPHPRRPDQRSSHRTVTRDRDFPATVRQSAGQEKSVHTRSQFSCVLRDPDATAFAC